MSSGEAAVVSDSSALLSASDSQNVVGELAITTEPAAAAVDKPTLSHSESSHETSPVNLASYASRSQAACVLSPSRPVNMTLDVLRNNPCQAQAGAVSQSQQLAVSLPLEDYKNRVYFDAVSMQSDYNPASNICVDVVARMPHIETIISSRHATALSQPSETVARIAQLPALANTGQQATGTKAVPATLSVSAYTTTAASVAYQLPTTSQLAYWQTPAPSSVGTSTVAALPLATSAVSSQSQSADTNSRKGPDADPILLQIQAARLQALLQGFPAAAAPTPQSHTPASLTARRQFTCDLCGKKLSSQHNLRLHEATIHRGLFQFHCPICNKGLRQERDLRGHMANRHDWKKEFRCSVCGHEFGYKRNLKHHVISHHGRSSLDESSD